MKLASVSQVSKMDQSAVEDYSIPELLLMENAASACCRVIKKKFMVEGSNFLILCGTGNNGGDGLALARLLYSEGGAPLVLLYGEPEKLKGAALQNFNILKKLPIEIINRYNNDLLTREINDTDIIIDAILGTGLNRNIKGELENIIDIINSSPKPVISIDIPTGINGDSGRVMGTAVFSQTTITFGSLKRGNILFPGYSHCGEIYLSRISMPPEIYDSEEINIELNICSTLPERDIRGNKKTFGDILTISGASAYYGAPRFAASAVLKSGAGYSRLAAPKSIIPFLSGSMPEVVFIPQNETSEGSVAGSNLPRLLKTGEKVDAVIIGPGLSLNKETAQFIRDFVDSYKNFLLIDGDGLTAVAGKENLLTKRELPAVLTPHQGEMSRLTEYSVSEIDNNPIKILQECSYKYNSVVVLKGAHSLIGFPDGKVYINMSGNSGMGTAGTGDILSGIIAAFFGLGMDLHDAVKNGVFIHGAAGDAAAEKIGEDSITASDILSELPLTIKKYRADYLSFRNYHKKSIFVI